MKWTDIEDIAEMLEDKFPEQDVLQIRFTDLYKWVLDLDEFSDQPERCNEQVLEAVQSAWMEIRNEAIN